MARMIYVPPKVVVHKVTMEDAVAQMIAVSARVMEVKWVDDEEIMGIDPAAEGGDIFFF